RFFNQLEPQINLVQISADAQQHPARINRNQVIVVQAVLPADQVLDAVGLAQEFAAVEGINVKFSRIGLKTAKEVAGQTDASYRQAQPPREQNVKQAQINRVPAAMVNDAVQVAVLRIVIIFVISGKTEFAEEVLVDRSQD